MIKLRLSRLGKKNDPMYRIVAIESSRKRDGKAIDVLGSWDPKKKKLVADSKKIQDWIKKGAQPSEKIKSLLKL